MSDVYFAISMVLADLLKNNIMRLGNCKITSVLIPLTNVALWRKIRGYSILKSSQDVQECSAYDGKMYLSSYMHTVEAI